MSNLGLPKFQGSKTSSQSRYICIIREQITPGFSYIGYNVKKMRFFCYSRGGGGLGLAYQLCSHLYQSTL